MSGLKVLAMMAAVLVASPMLMVSPLRAQIIETQLLYPGKPHGGGGPPGTVPPEAGVCSPQERQLVDNAFRDAGTMVRAAILHLDENPNSTEYRRWFGVGPRPPVRRNLVSIADYLGRTRPPAISCNSQAMCPRGRFAYTMNASGAMGFCELFFRALDSGFDSRAGIVIHEVSHVAARTRDVAYSVRGATLLAKEDPDSAAVNADSYEYFVESLRR